MKNFVKALSLFLFIACSLSLSAQISIGPKVGINWAKWGGNFDGLEYFDNSKVENETGYQFGISADIPINDMISIQPEVLYVQKGVRLQLETLLAYYYGTNNTFFFKHDVNINYLEIPILVKVKFGPEEGIKFFANAGPSFAYALNGKTSEETIYNGFTDTSEDNIIWANDTMKRTEFNLVFGAGATYPVGLVNIFIEARYSLGLTNIIDDSYLGRTSVVLTDIKNLSVGLFLGALIQL